MQNEAVVHVVDDDHAVRKSLSFLLASDGLAVRAHESAVAFLDDLDQPGRGCVVTDVRMPEVDGIELLRRLNARGSKMPVIVITGHADVPLAVEAMKHGAVDFIEKPFGDDAFLGAVRAALENEGVEADRHRQAQRVQEAQDTLSEREAQVLEGLLEGKANKVMAQDMGISPRTVEIYRANVMAKMKAGSLSELIRMVLQARGGG